VSIEIFFSCAHLVEKQKKIGVHRCFLTDAAQKLNHNFLKRDHFFAFNFGEKIFPKRQLGSARHFWQLLHQT